MLANWVKESTATTGTGDITLGGAPSGFIPFSQVFRDGQAVYYTIEDGANREIGIGTYNAGVLSRTTVLETLEGGTYTGPEGSPSPITLSGSATVMVSDSASFFQQGAYKKSTPEGYGHGIIGDNLIGFNAYDAVIPAADTLYLVPYLISSYITVDELWVNVVTAGNSGEVAKAAIYDADVVARRPVNKICETGDILIDATGITRSALSVPVTLTPGWYYVGLATNSSVVKFRGHHTQAGGQLGGVNVNKYSDACLELPVTGWTGTGSLPDPPFTGESSKFFTYLPVVFINFGQ